MHDRVVGREIVLPNFSGGFRRFVFTKSRDQQCYPGGRLPVPIAPLDERKLGGLCRDVLYATVY